ncbi:TIGR00730 family Rossman fold protein [Tatumella ptyseos]|uniref:LOG family protein n=1 Tax=Tatumella ptyseos TaxID=82987 RepID=UPI0023F098A9|nr:TIGR00730 family Rossman fold protein [Tatumella ptyseos]
MIEAISTEIENIAAFKHNIVNAVGVFGSARIKESDNYYQQAKEVARRLVEHGYQVITGGGPGIMKAAIEGSQIAGMKSIALNIRLPFESDILPQKKLSLDFNYFMTRKLAFAQYCDAFIAMPGGFGTLDELFEMLTLIQTGKMSRKPVFLLGSEFWRNGIAWLRELRDSGLISATDLDNIFITDSADDVLDKLERNKNDQ